MIKTKRNQTRGKEKEKKENRKQVQKKVINLSYMKSIVTSGGLEPVHCVAGVTIDLLTPSALSTKPRRIVAFRWRIQD